jgi:ABC-type oligopeptide transport system substrate-binding subunit
MRRLGPVAALLLALLGAAAHGQGRDTLTIGITQFPATLHPMIDSMAAKTYVLHMARRPLTTYGADWKLACLLCVELPTFENGGARRVALPDGKEGAEVTFRIHPDAKWGDGRPVTARDAILAWDVGRHPRSGVASGESYRRILKVEANRLHQRPRDVQLQRLQPVRAAARSCRAGALRERSRDLPAAHRLRYRANEPSPVQRPLSHRRGAAGCFNLA